MATIDIGPALQQIIRDTAAQTAYLVEDELVAQVVAAVADANSRTARTVVTLGELLKAGVAGMGPKLESAHAELARGAQQATLESYDAARQATGRHSPPYRVEARDPRNRRYAGGFLRGALESSSFATATEQGILFGNISVLDAAARQWARLNFGAGAAAGEGGPPQSYGVRWSNLEVASFGLEEGPRPAFRIPQGYWFGPAFYPVSEVPRGYRLRGGVRQAARMTAGIRAEHWLDVGLIYIAQNLGDTYRNIYKQIWDEAKGGVAQAGGVALTRPGRPRSSVGVTLD